MSANFRGPNRFWTSGVVLFLIGFALAAGPGAAQGPQRTLPQEKASTPPISQPTDFQIFKLKHIAAINVADRLSQLLVSPTSAVRIVADPNSNSLLVAAPGAETGKVIEALLSKMDVPTPGLAEPEVRTRLIELRSVEPDTSFEEALSLMLTRQSFAIDRARKLLVLNADDKQVEYVQTLIRQLEKSARAPAISDMQVRVVWLASGPIREDASERPPPDDLKEVLPSLTKLGIEKPRLVAQSLVNVTPNSKFETYGVATLGSACQFSISGQLADDGEANQPPHLVITINAARQRDKGTERLCQLSTVITAPSGHLVVLGATPTESVTSVFVVQVLRKDGK